MIMSMPLRSLYVCVELKKMVLRVLIIPFVKAKRDLEMFPPAHYALELHIKRTNYRAKIWLQAGHAIANLDNKPTETIGRQDGTDEQEVV